MIQPGLSQAGVEMPFDRLHRSQSMGCSECQSLPRSRSQNFPGVATGLSGLSLEPTTLSMTASGWVSSMFPIKTELQTVTGGWCLRTGMLREEGYELFSFTWQM